MEYCQHKGYPLENKEKLTLSLFCVCVCVHTEVGKLVFQFVNVQGSKEVLKDKEKAC